MRILLVEDDPALRGFITNGLQEEDYAVDAAGDGEDGQVLALDQEYDLMILDLGLPKRSGLEVLTRVRRQKQELPVIVLTANRAVGDRVKGLDMGADDYLTKPFAWSELSARVRALLRRRTRPAESTLRVDDLELNRLEHRVSRDDRRIDLTQKEFALLEYLMRHPGRPLTRAMILDNVWGLDFDPTTNVVDVYVNYLRKKIDLGAERKLIHTVRNVGYCIRGEERAAAGAGPPPSAGQASRSRRSPRNGNSKTRRF